MMTIQTYKSEKYEEILTDEKCYDKRENIDRVDNKKYDKIYHIQKKQLNKINLKDSVTNETDQIENPTKLNMINIQEIRKYKDLTDTDTDQKHVLQKIVKDLEESETDETDQIKIQKIKYEQNLRTQRR